MKYLLLTFCATILWISGASGQALKRNKWVTLFNGKDLNGWETYLDSPYAKNKADKKPPIGLNNDPNHVFSVANVDGKPALRISGETYGGINTLSDFENYHLRMEFKWGTQKWPPKLNQARDSGLLYHSVGPHGTPMLWMESFEFQVQEGDCGDYWGVMNVLADIPAAKNEQGKFVYQAGGTPVTFQDKTPNGRTCLKFPVSENPSGDWNTIDLYCYGDTCVHIMNGKINMILTKTRHVVNGQTEPLTKGKIQIQSEGAEVFYRNIRIMGIDKLPAKLVQ